MTLNTRSIVATAVVVMIFTAAVRWIAPKVPILDRVAPYI